MAIEYYVDNAYYQIGEDTSINRLYIKLKTGLRGEFTNKVLNKNIFNNCLSYTIHMPDQFTIVLHVRDLELVDPQYFEFLMGGFGRRLEEMGKLKAHAQIMRDDFFDPYGGIDQVIVDQDEDTGKPVGYFKYQDEAEVWLDTL